MNDSTRHRSGEYELPVSQAVFNAFIERFDARFDANDRTLQGINQRLSDGQATMAVLASNLTRIAKQSDEHSSKINLLAIRDTERTTREKAELDAEARAEKTAEKNAAENEKNLKEATWLARLIREKASSVIVGLIVAGIATTLWGIMQRYNQPPTATTSTTTTTSIPVPPLIPAHSAPAP